MSESAPPSPGRTRILIIEDDPTVSEVVVRYLAREGFEVEAVLDGKEGLQRALADPPDLIVLDIMLPGLDGLEVFRRVRERIPVPIVLLTALGEETDRVLGLDLGADDYITKPFSPRELTARVKSVLRRARGPLAATAPELQTPLNAGHLQVDVQAREVRVGGEVVGTTAKEFELLTFLMTHPRRVFTREDLLDQVWGYAYGDTSTVTVHVRRLREKIESDPAHPELIQTVWGIGYRFGG